jgi:hypothetical protein
MYCHIWFHEIQEEDKEKLLGYSEVVLDEEFGVR